MKKLTILVDMDDTIEQLLQAWLLRLNARYHRNVCCEDILVWDVTQAYEGLTHDEVYNVLLEDDFWETILPIPGAAEALQRFMQAGHTIYIVTVTPYETVADKMGKLLFKYFPFIPWENVIITTNKTMLKADVLIDDGIHNLENGDYAKILVDAPYNRYYDAEANGMVRVYNWTEIEKEVNRLAMSDEE